MRVGIYQCQAGQVPPVARLADLAGRVEGLDLLICPELFLSGYHAGAGASAEAQDGPFGQEVARIAAQSGTAIAYGYPEAADGVIYNAAALYDGQGQLRATHRKRLPSPGSFEEKIFASGAGVSYANLGAWRVAMIICYEVEFPENLRAAARQGAELIIVPTALGADWGVVAEHVVPARAYENGVWIAYADQVGEADGARFYGGSRIADPAGVVHAKAGPHAGVITTELDKEAIARMRRRIPFLRDSSVL